MSTTSTVETTDRVVTFTGADLVRLQDHDDSLAAAEADVAEDLGVEDWQVTARFDSDRDAIVVDVASLSDEWTIEAAHAKASECVDTAGAVDVDVTLTMPDGEKIEGDVTLVPRDSDGVLDGWGSPDHWLSAPLVRALWAQPERIRDALLPEIRACAREAAKANT